MSSYYFRFRRQLVVACATILFVLPVFAEKPTKGGSDKHKQKPQHEKQHNEFKQYDHKDAKHYEKHQDRYVNERYFGDRHRTIVHDYYFDQFRSGHCPPGLAKKHNGCLPPGQAKRWTIGRPLPGDVVFYDLPDGLIRQIGYPPAGYRFVRVASDILMIAAGTGLVVDAIADLNAMR